MRIRLLNLFSEIEMQGTTVRHRGSLFITAVATAARAFLGLLDDDDVVERCECCRAEEEGGKVR